MKICTKRASEESDFQEVSRLKIEFDGVNIEVEHCKTRKELIITKIWDLDGKEDKRIFVIPEVSNVIHIK